MGRIVGVFKPQRKIITWCEGLWIIALHTLAMAVIIGVLAQAAFFLLGSYPDFIKGNRMILPIFLLLCLLWALYKNLPSCFLKSIVFTEHDVEFSSACPRKYAYKDYVIQPATMKSMRTNKPRSWGFYILNRNRKKIREYMCTGFSLEDFEKMCALLEKVDRN